MRTDTDGKQLPPITLVRHDYERLERLVDADGVQPDVADFLAEELARADVVGADAIGPGTVTMGSTVTFRDDGSGAERTVTLVYPQEADIATGRISVMTPIGAVLIGMSSGQSIGWQDRAGHERLLTVVAVQD